MSTVTSGLEFEEVVVDVLRDGLRAAIDDDEYLFEDADDRNRPVDPGPSDEVSALVLTSFPSRHVTYPHVVVREVGASSEQMDNRADVWRDNYTVRFECYGRSSTEAGKFAGGVRGWLKNNKRELRDAGFHDPSISDTSDMQHFEEVRTGAKKVTLSGRLYTA